MAAPPIQLQLFGAFALHVEGISATGVPKPGQELLARLAVGGRGGVDRVETATSLWPDAEGERALFYLRRSLTQLRTVLGSQRARLKASGDRRIVFDLDGCSCDLTRFDFASHRPDPKSLAIAADAYGGKLLLGHRSEWVRQLRATCAGRHSQLLCQLAAIAEAGGELDAAHEWLNRALQADPVREETCRQLMRLLARSGDFAAIVRAFRDLRVSLRRVVGLPPSQVTVDLYRELLAGARLVASARSDTERIAGGVSTLPAPPTPFFGRETEQAVLLTALSERRLVTLTGHGGVGKTRLAIQVAQAFSSQFAFHVAFVDLSVFTTAAEVDERIARAVGVSDSGVPFDPVARTLLVVDGAEHVVSGCIAVLGKLLESAGELHVLCTSRIALQMREEHVILLDPMRLPTPRDDAKEEPAAAEAVAFFLQCAKRVAPAVRAEQQDLGQVVELCRRLDGLPLALELAAVRLRTLPLRDIVANLDNQFGLLDPAPDGRDRRTLKNVLEWSFRLLSPGEAMLFVRLGVFPSSWTVAASQAVCGSSELSSDHIPLLLSGLVDHSLVAYDASAGSYRMLETVRAYARKQLGKEPATLRELRERHADHYLAVAAHIGPDSSNAEQEEANFVAAIDEFLSSAQTERRSIALRLVNRLFPHWYRLGSVSDGLRTALRVIKAYGDSPSEVLTEALFRAASAAHWLYNIDLSKDLFGRAEAIADMLDLEAWGTESIRSRGELAANEGRLQEARELLHVALRRFRLAEDPLGEAACLGMLGYVARQSLEDGLAFELTEAALAIYTAHDNSEGRLWCLGSLAAAHVSARSPQRAVPILLETLELQERAGNWPAQAWNLTMLGTAHVQLGEFESGENFFTRALSLSGLDAEDLRKGWPTLELGELYRRAGRLKEAEATLIVALKLCRAGGAVSLEVRALLRLCLVAIDLGDLSSARAYRSAAKEALATLQKPPQIEELEEVNARIYAAEAFV